MKQLVTIALLFLGLTVFAQDGLEGDWKGSLETPNGPMELNYIFEVEDSTLTGSWKSQFGESEIEEGRIDGKNFSFSVSFNEMSIDFTGEMLNENEIVIKNDRGETKLTRVEE